MKKKCLGCGKVFEDTINICQNCFNAIENARRDIPLEKRYRKNYLCRMRNVSIFFSALTLSLIVTAFFFFFKATSILLKDSTSSRMLELFYFPLAGFLLSFGEGIFMGNYSAKKTFSQWRDKNWYTSSATNQTIRKRQFRLMLRDILLYGAIFPLNVILFSLIRPLIIKGAFFPHLDPLTTHFLVFGALSGIAMSGFFNTSWVARLSK